MITPDSESIPGQTMIQDPLAVNFMTGGQMGLMPQSQFLTDADYGLFRTMPTPDVNGYMSQGDPGWFQNYLMANRGSIAGLPAFTFNTYNPAISSVQQIQQAQRRRYDNGLDTIVGLADVGKSLGEGALVAAGPIGWAGIAASELVGTITKPVMERQATTRAIQNMSTSKVFGGPDSDPVSGYGFNFAGARSIDKFIRESAADDTLFKEGDYRDLLSLGMKYGQFDYSNNAGQYKQVLKKLRDNYTTMMEVLGSTDFEEIMKDMQRMQSMGARQESYGNIARDEQAYARMLGLSHQQAVDTYGKSGALTFQQMGLNAMQGSLQSMANAAGLTYLQRTGTLDPTTVAHYGGISGMAQNMTAQDARVQSNFQDMILPAMMNGSMTGLRTDINPMDLLSGNVDMGTIAAEAGRIRTPGQLANYQASRHKAYTQLQEQVGGADVLEMLMANQYGRMQGYEGQDATRMGLMLGGMDAETAMYKTQEFYSGAAQEARKRTQEEARQKRRDELEQRTNPLRRLERAFSRFTTAVGEGAHGVFAKLWGNTDREEANQAGRTIPWASPKSDIASKPDFRNENSEELLSLFHNANKAGGYTDEEAYAMLRNMGHAVYSETGKTDVKEAMMTTSTGGFGAMQITLGGVNEFLNGKGSKWKDEFMSHMKGVDMKKLAAMNDRNYSEYNEEEREIYKKAQEAWRSVAGQEGFAGAYMTHINQQAINQRDIYRKDPKIALLAQDAGMMTAMVPITNQFSIPAAEEILRAGVEGMSQEEIKAELAKDGGKEIVKRMYKVADRKMNAKKKRDDKGNIINRDNRYSEGGTDMQTLFANMDKIRSAGSGARAGGGWSELAKSVGESADFIDHYSQKKFNADSTRPDCSGYVHEVLKQYIKNNGGVIPEDSEIYRYFAEEKVGWKTAKEEYKKLSEAAGGGITFNRQAGESEADYVKRLEEGLEEGMVVTWAGKGEADPNKIHHIGIVAIDENGRKVIRHQHEHGGPHDKGENKASSIAEWSAWSKGDSMLAVDTKNIFKNVSGARSGKTRAQWNEELRKARDAGYEQTRKLYETKVQGMEARGGVGGFILGKLGLNDADITVGKAAELGAVMNAAEEGNYRSKPVMDYMNSQMNKISGIGALDLTEDELNAALENESSNLSIFKNWSLSNDESRKDRSNGLYKATVSLLKRRGLSDEQADTEAAKLMQNKNWTSSMQTALFANNIGGKGGLSDKVRLQGMKLNVAVNGQTLNGLGKLQADDLRDLLQKTMFVGKDAGLFDKIGEAVGIKEHYGELYQKAISDDRKVEGQEYTVGQLNETLPAVYRLLKAQEDLQKWATPGSGLSEDQRKAAEEQLTQTNLQLATYFKSHGVDSKKAQDIINGANGLSGAEAKSKATQALLTGGLTETDEQRKLRELSLSYGEVDKDDAKANFEQYKKFTTYLKESGLMKGDRLHDMQDLGNANTAAGVFQALSRYGIDMDFLQKVHKKDEITEEDFNYKLKELEKENATDAEKRLAKMIRKSRETGEKLDFWELKEGVEAAAGPIGNNGTPSPMVSPEERRMAQLNAAFGLGGSGGGGGMFSAETDKALGQLPEVLSKLNDTLTKVDDTLKKNNR